MSTFGPALTDWLERFMVGETAVAPHKPAAANRLANLNWSLPGQIFRGTGRKCL
ncbi:MAG: hypothetical protein IT327_27390 [Anaerolineae bacterium]|nr:hypothetical protein [Anaerolineae bacterium]